jgi:hypothetical protein
MWATKKQNRQNTICLGSNKSEPYVVASMRLMHGLISFS